MYIFLAKQQDYACCPQIVLKPPSSLINSLSVYRAYFELIIDYGNCTYDIADDSIFQLVNQINLYSV